MLPETNDLENYPMKVFIYFQKTNTDRLLCKNISSLTSQLMNVFTVLAYQRPDVLITPWSSPKYCMIEHRGLYFLALKGTNINLLNPRTKEQITLNTAKHCFISNYNDSILPGLESSAKVI